MSKIDDKKVSLKVLPGLPKRSPSRLPRSVFDPRRPKAEQVPEILERINPKSLAFRTNPLRPSMMEEPRNGEGEPPYMQAVLHWLLPYLYVSGQTDRTNRIFSVPERDLLLSFLEPWEQYLTTSVLDKHRKEVDEVVRRIFYANDENYDWVTKLCQEELLKLRLGREDISVTHIGNVVKTDFRSVDFLTRAIEPTFDRIEETVMAKRNDARFMRALYRKLRIESMPASHIEDRLIYVTQTMQVFYLLLTRYAREAKGEAL